MSLQKLKTSLLKFLLTSLILISLIKLSLQESNGESDQELIKTVKSLRKKANEKKAEYAKYEIPKNLSNITNFTEYDNITNIAIFLNKTGISHLKQSVTNQRTSGIRKEYISKYLESLSKRFEFSEEIKTFFGPLFVNITEKDERIWNNYELMYKKNSTNTTLFVCILAKNKKEGKVDFVINQVELEYQFSNFLVLKINTSDSTGKESTDYKIVKTDVTGNVRDYELEATLDVLAATGYNSLAEFLEIKDDFEVQKDKSFLSFLQ
jgi:hypothetical protein